MCMMISVANDSKSEDGVAAAGICPQNYEKPYTCRLPNVSSVFTAELRAILLAVRHVYHSQENSFLILSDSLSSLQARHNMKYDHHILIINHELHSDLLFNEEIYLSRCLAT